MDIAGRRIILTGAASGIGRAVLVRLAQYPCQVVAADRAERALQESVAALAGSRARLVSFVFDAARPESVDALFEYAVRMLGGADLFIACAGFAYYERLVDADWARMEEIARVNFISPVYSALHMHALNAEQPYRVVVVASAMGRLGIPGYALYSGTKAAIHRFAEAYRLELPDPSSLALVYPIGTRTGFFAAAGGAPRPWPTQSADQVARAIIRGIEADRRSIYPSVLFRAILMLDRVLPLTRRLEQAIERRRFLRWLRSARLRSPDCRNLPTVK